MWQHRIDHTLSRCASPLDVAKSSGRVLFILCIAAGAVTGAWFFLPLESITSFCSLLVTASFYSWLSLAHKYRGPFPFLLGDSSTFSLSCAGRLWLHLGSQSCTGTRFSDYKMSPWKLHHVQEGVSIHTSQGSPYWERKNNHTFVPTS